MMAVHLPAASCWRVMFGENFTDVRGTLHWATREALEADLRRAGLRLNPDNSIVAAGTQGGAA